jgi:hypothetical protein
LAVGSPTGSVAASGAPVASDATETATSRAGNPTERGIDRSRRRGSSDAGSDASSSTDAPAPTALHTRAATADEEGEKRPKTSDHVSSGQNPLGEAQASVLVKSDPMMPNVGSSPFAGASSNVAIADLPDTIATLASHPAAASSATSSAGMVQPASTGGHVVRELELSLDPAEMGKIYVKLRSDGMNLSVVIEVQKRDSLKQIEAQKEQIAQRLSADGQTVSSVVVREAPAAANSTNGNEASGAAGDMSGSNGNADRSLRDETHGSDQNRNQSSSKNESAPPRQPSSRLNSDGSARGAASGVFF